MPVMLRSTLIQHFAFWTVVTLVQQAHAQQVESSDGTFQVEDAEGDIGTDGATGTTAGEEVEFYCLCYPLRSNLGLAGGTDSSCQSFAQNPLLYPEIFGDLSGTLTGLYYVSPVFQTPYKYTGNIWIGYDDVPCPRKNSPIILPASPTWSTDNEEFSGPRPWFPPKKN